MTVSDGSLVFVNHKPKKLLRPMDQSRAICFSDLPGRVRFGLPAKLTKESREKLVGSPGASGVADY